MFNKELNKLGLWNFWRIYIYIYILFSIIFTVNPPMKVLLCCCTHCTINTDIYSKRWGKNDSTAPLKSQHLHQMPEMCLQYTYLVSAPNQIYQLVVVDRILKVKVTRYLGYDRGILGFVGHWTSPQTISLMSESTTSQHDTKPMPVQCWSAGAGQHLFNKGECFMPVSVCPHSTCQHRPNGG